jgi:hypothetical protein
MIYGFKPESNNEQNRICRPEACDRKFKAKLCRHTIKTLWRKPKFSRLWNDLLNSVSKYETENLNWDNPINCNKDHVLPRPLPSSLFAA